MSRAVDQLLDFVGDHDDPAKLVKQVGSQLNLPQKPRIAVSDAARAETVVGLQKLYPEARFSSATALLNPLRRVKSEAEVEMMREAGVVTEQAFQAVLDSKKSVTRIAVSIRRWPCCSILALRTRATAMISGEPWPLANRLATSNRSLT